MSRIIVSANDINHMNDLLNKNIDGIILFIDKLSVNSSFYIDINLLETLDFKGKEVIVSLNKNMHNNDLDYLYLVMKKLNEMNVRIIFYDMAVFSIARELKMIDRLIICQDHLNACSLSNSFYKGLGINSSYVTSDITGEELLEIKKNTGMELFFRVYGYAPIFYSRRYLITNYLKYINEENDGDKYTIVSDTGEEYPIDEEENGTTIYSKRKINLINQIDKLKDIDCIVMHSYNIDNQDFNIMVDKFINHESMDDVYEGFFNIKTIYKVKGQ